MGELARDGEANETLRFTLLAFVEHQCRRLPTAAATFLHRNTVAEPIRRAETILGRRVTDREAELKAALRLHRHFARAHRTGSMPPTT